MQNIDCTIDTRPMADELQHVSQHVKGTTAAVIGMQAAVIAADKEAADRVCGDVNRGFHALMSSQLSQKIAKLQSDVDSHLMRLNQQTKQLLAIRKQMERDYQRTAQRYSKTFGALNKELQQRVQELDQPVFKFATTEMQVTTNRMSSLTATVPVVQSESVSDAQRILSSNVKYHGLQVLETSKEFVARMNEQRILTSSILLQHQKALTAVRYLPAVFMDCVYAQGSSTTISTSDDLLAPQCKRAVENMVMQREKDMDWKQTQPNREVQNELVRLLADAPLSDRLKNTISNLMKQAPTYQTL